MHRTSSPSSFTNAHFTVERLQEYFGAYDRLQSDLWQEIYQRAQLSHETQRATTAAAIAIIDVARAFPVQFSLRQVFFRYPIHSPEGQTLFQLITQLCHITDKAAQQAFIQECFACASWMKDTKRRDQFLSTTSSWGLSLANRFFSTVNEKPQPSMSQRFARRFGTPIMRKTIMQAVYRLTQPLIFAANLEEALRKKNRSPLHLRPALPYSITKDDGVKNQQVYIQLIERIFEYTKEHPRELAPSLHIEIHHFVGLFDLRQVSRVNFLLEMLAPVVDAARTHKITIILNATQPFPNPLLRLLIANLLPMSIDPEQKHATLGIELSAAEPSSLETLKYCQSLAMHHEIILPIRLTKERTKPSLEQSAVIHCAYVALAQLCLYPDSHVVPWFVTHHAYTLACVQHMAQELQQHNYEIHHRCGVGQRCQLAFEKQFQGSIRMEAPLGDTHQHHHMILQRLREFTDPQGFLNQLYDENTTTASLVNHPTRGLKRMTPPVTDFWGHRKVKPHVAGITSFNPPTKTSEYSLETAEQLLEEHQQSIGCINNVDLEIRFEKLKTAHQHCIDNAAHWANLIVEHMDIPLPVAELYIEAALQQQERFLNKPFKHINVTSRRFPRGQILIIGSAQRPLSPLLEQVTRALLLGNRVFIKPATATLSLISEVLQAFQTAGFEQHCFCLPLAHNTLQELLRSTQNLESIVFDGLQQHAKTLAAFVLQNSKQPPIPFLATPASSCISTQGMCLIDESASDQELFLLVSDAWKMGPMIILATPPIALRVQAAFMAWRDSLVIGDAHNQDTQLSLTQSLQPFPIDLAPRCTSVGIEQPISIPAPQQQHPFFQIITFEDDNLVPLLQALGKDAQLNRFTLLTRMPVRIKNILEALPAHEIHLGWPKDYTSFMFRGLESSAFEVTTHILRHQRLHPWTNNGTFDITDV